MIKTNLATLAKALNAKLVGGDTEISQVVTDSRADCSDGLFVALRGPHFDAHDFLSQVIQQGAKALVVENESALLIPQLVVNNSKLALGDLARINRAKLKAKFVAITGSSGKTTVKEMIASVLQNVAKTFATQGNLNNDIGVPLTLLAMNESHQYGVIELGANHAGEIAYTAEITQADVALINNVAAAHLQGFGDLHGVAQAKGEIFTELNKKGIAVINNDDDFASYWKRNIQCKQLTFSVKGDADVTANNIQLDNNQCPQFELEYAGNKCFICLPLAGLHNVNNALATAACCIALGISLQDISIGLSQAPVVSGRLMSKTLSNGCRIIDDSYNANLDSMRVAINLLAGFSGRKILVIGDMAELGESGRQCHEQVGEMAKQSDIDVMYSCGVLTQFAQSIFNGTSLGESKQSWLVNKGQHYSNQQKLIQQLKQETNANTTILIKGSRSAHMENVVMALMDDFEASNETNINSSIANQSKCLPLNQEKN